MSSTYSDFLLFATDVRQNKQTQVYLRLEKDTVLASIAYTVYHEISRYLNRKMCKVENTLSCESVAGYASWVLEEQMMEQFSSFCRKID